MYRATMARASSAAPAHLDRKMDRRSVLRVMLGAGAVAAGGFAHLALGDDAAARSGTGRLRTTTALNLRAKPSLKAKVLLVMPKGAIVTDQHAEKNGFMKVGYQGTIGWAYIAYLEPADSGDPPIIGQAITTTAVNFRSGPSTGDSVLRVLPKGTAVEISNLVSNGFRYAVHNGQAGWIYDQYLAPHGGEGPAHFTTITAVNLRAKPSTSSNVLLVVPAGAVVDDYDLEIVDGFRSVDYKGTVGWIYDAYLE